MAGVQTASKPVLTRKATTTTGGITMSGQDKLPHLPIPPLADTMKRYVNALEGLQVSPFLCLSPTRILFSFLRSLELRTCHESILTSSRCISHPPITLRRRKSSPTFWRRMDQRCMNDWSTTPVRGLVSSRSGGRSRTSRIPIPSCSP